MAAGKLLRRARGSMSKRNLFLGGVVALSLFAAFVTSAVKAQVGVELSADDASAISGGSCAQWTFTRCERPNQTTCTRRGCWRWYGTSGDYDNNSPGVWCCLANTPCDAVVSVQYPCNSAP